jgi:hypothetical protein
MFEHLAPSGNKFANPEVFFRRKFMDTVGDLSPLVSMVEDVWRDGQALGLGLAHRDLELDEVLEMRSWNHVVGIGQPIAIHRRKARRGDEDWLIRIGEILRDERQNPNQIVPKQKTLPPKK